MRYFRPVWSTLWLLVLVWLVASASSAAAPEALITVSGTITDPDGHPVVNLWLGIDSPQDGQAVVTNASGFYSVAIQTDGQLAFHLRPQASTRLAPVNLQMDGVTTSFTQNFSLSRGYLLELQLTGNGGPWLEAKPMLRQPKQEWYGLERVDEANNRYQSVLPPDIYYVTAHYLTAKYYMTTQVFDLRTADQSATMALNTTLVNPIPYDPPDASKITFGPLDDLGEALVTGAPGAALPFAHVLLVNLSSTHQAHAISEGDGSFVARIYAPPGSAVMVKHGPDRWDWTYRWDDLDVGIAMGVEPFPGTIINLPHTHAGGRYALPFAAAGAIDYFADDPNTTRNYVGAAWAMTGTLGPVIVEGQWTRVLSGAYDGRMMGGLYLGGLNWTHPAPVDLDTDGDLDLVIGERSGHLIYYRNDGGPTAGFSAASWTFVTDHFAGVDTGNWAAPAFADLDGDGDLDLLVGTGQGTVALYRRDPGDVWTLVNATYLSVSGYNAAPSFADLDGDGDLDLLIGYTESDGSQGRLSFFRRGGTTSAPTWALVTAQYAGIAANGSALPAFSDLDGDGDLDLLVGQGGRMAHYRNDGPPPNPTWTLVTANFAGIGGSSAVSPAFGDLDGDGAQDLVTGEHWGQIAFYRHAGTAWDFISNDLFPFDLAGDSAPALADWDHDGDLDLLVGQVWGQVHQYTNIGTATSPAWRSDGVLLTLPWTNHPHAFPTFADLDGDGDADLLIGEGGYDGTDAGGNLHYYRNDGTPTAPSWTLVTPAFLGIDVGGWATPAFADIDADGDLDLFIGDAAGTLSFVQNIGTRTAPAWATPVRPYAGLQLGSYSAPAFLDVDGDGDLDLFSGRGDGGLAYVRNDGAPTAPAWKLIVSQYPGIRASEQSAPAAADLDGDGHQDLLLGGNDGGLSLYHYLGPGTPPAGPSTFATGDLFQIDGVLRLYSPAITVTTPLSSITAGGWLWLWMIADAQGRPLAATNAFMSTLLAPTGFPIQGGGQPPSEWLNTRLEVTNLRHAGGNVLEGDVTVTGRLPTDLPPGIYRPTLSLEFSGVPTSTQWLAANVIHYAYGANGAALPPIHVLSRVEGTVGNVAAPRLIWRLLMDDFVQGTRGAGARQDKGYFELSSDIVSQGATFAVPPVDARTGQPITYRLEPFLPMISFTDRRIPAPPLLPLALPGGRLSVQIEQPDGTIRDLGSEPFAQAFHRTRTTRGGYDLNGGTVQLDDVYSLMTAADRFHTTFTQYGHHIITMTGAISDTWGNTYTGGGAYDLWVAHPLDIDPGVLPATPFQVGDTFNPSLRLSPGVPADVSLTLTLYPNSNPAQAITYTVTGQANDYGYFAPEKSTNQRISESMGRPIRSFADSLILSHAGEYRVDLTALYTDTNGILYMGAMVWGGVVETPNSPLVAHGRRGLDSLSYIPPAWFVASRDLTILPGAVSHSLNPYFNGDIIWSRMSDMPWGGDALVMGASIQDTVGTVEAAIRARLGSRSWLLSPPGSLEERFAAGEIPLFISTRSGRTPPLAPQEVDQWAYSYRTSQRPGVRVREVVAEDGHNGGYWRLDTLYDDQLSVGILGDLPNDFKFQYVGTVYRDLQAGINLYGIQGSLWVFIPEDDPLGSRVMPPFAGPGNGGWTREGGPILKLKGQDIHMFILPTGTMPGAVLEVGDTFRFAGHIAPTLNSKVAITVASPSGAKHLGSGQANQIGYYYDPADDFTVDEPGLWAVDVRVWHDGVCSGGQTVPPYPSGDVLGSENGRYWFYVAPSTAPRLHIAQPQPGRLTLDVAGGAIQPIVISGRVPITLTQAVVDYTIVMPGFILAHGQAPVTNGGYAFTFDPVALHRDFPNLDLTGRESAEWPGLADTFTISLLLRGQDARGNVVYQANTITLQGEQVFVGAAVEPTPFRVFLPMVLKQ